MDEIIYVTPGHYCLASTINQEQKTIIRILGPSKDRELHWVDEEGNQYSGYTLMHDWVKIDMTSPYRASSKPKKDLLAGFKPVIIDDRDSDPATQHQHQSLPSSPGEVSAGFMYVEPKPIQQPVDEFKEIRSIVEKTRVEKLNKVSVDKYGEARYREQVLSLTIDIPIPFELTKLKTAAEMFELDVNEVADFIMSEVELPIAQVLSALKSVIISGDVTGSGISLTERQTTPKEDEVVKNHVKAWDKTSELLQELNERVIQLQEMLSTGENQEELEEDDFETEQTESEQVIEESELVPPRNAFAHLTKSNYDWQ